MPPDALMSQQKRVRSGLPVPVSGVSPVPAPPVRVVRIVLVPPEPVPIVAPSLEHREVAVLTLRFVPHDPSRCKGMDRGGRHFPIDQELELDVANLLRLNGGQNAKEFSNVLT